MENFGAITYRETAMLVDEKTASINAKKVVAVDVAHEMAHQWFGDMVTMEWWNNIWLNEGFATWMSNKPLAVWKPEWQIPRVRGLRAQSNPGPRRRTRNQGHSRAGRHPRRDQRDVRRHILRKGCSRAPDDGALSWRRYFRDGVRRYLRAHMLAMPRQRTSGIRCRPPAASQWTRSWKAWSRSRVSRY